MSRSDVPIVSAVPLAVLARRASLAPHSPWIFDRDGWDWRWRSWARVSDQVARGVEALRQRWPGDKPAIGFDAGQHADAVAAGLAIQAAGAVAVPITGSGGDALEAALAAGCGAWATTAEAFLPEPPAGLERLDLPAALSAFDRTAPRTLELDVESLSGELAVPARGRLSQTELGEAATRLERLLPLPAGRPIVCVVPGLDPRVSQVVQAWLLAADAAWVLEDEPEAFVPTVLWARPILVIATAAELASLASALAERKHRRHHRIEAIGLVGEKRPEAASWDDLGVPIVDLGF